MNKHYLTQDDRHAGNVARWKDYQKQQLVCQECGKAFSVPPSVIKKGKGRYCSQKCANQAKGRAMSVTRQVKANGYVYIKTWTHPNRSKQNLVAEHRLIIEKAIGRYLKPKEAVHHIDKNKTNNELFNLFLCKNNAEHRKIHHLDPVFLMMFNIARYQHSAEFAKFDVTKDRQDQLQEMIENKAPGQLLWEFYSWYHDKQIKATIIESDRLFFQTTMEQLWLAFVMEKKFGKVWNFERKEWGKV